MVLIKERLVLSELVGQLAKVFFTLNNLSGWNKLLLTPYPLSRICRLNSISIVKNISGFFFLELLIFFNLRLKLGILFLKSVLLSKNFLGLVVPSHAVNFGKTFLVGLELLIVRINGIIQLIDALTAILGCLP